MEQLKQIQERYGERLGLIAVMSGDWTQRARSGGPRQVGQSPFGHRRWHQPSFRTAYIICHGQRTMFASGLHLLAATGLVKISVAVPKPNNLPCNSSRSDVKRTSRIKFAFANGFKNGMNPGAAWENAIKAYMQSIPENDIDRSADQDKQAFPPDLLTGSNNWLAIEYIKAAKSLGNAGPRITILRRRGQAYLDDQATGESTGKLLSATAVRTALYHLFGYPTESSNWNTELWNKLCHSLPDYTAGTLLRAGLNKTMGFNEQIGPYILATLLAVPKSYLTTLAGFSTDFSNRLIKTANQLVDLPPTAVWQQLIEAVTSRNLQPLTHPIFDGTGFRHYSKAEGFSHPGRSNILESSPFDKTGLFAAPYETAADCQLSPKNLILEYNHLGTVFAQQYKTDIG